MSLVSVLARARAAAARLMVDTCVITYVTGQVTDPLSGDVIVQRATRYAGPCRIQQPAQTARRFDAGETSDLLLHLQLQIPVAGTEAVTTGDLVSVTAATNDQALTGRTFRIRDLAHKTHASARRLTLEEDT